MGLGHDSSTALTELEAQVDAYSHLMSSATRRASRLAQLQGSSNAAKAKAKTSSRPTVYAPANWTARQSSLVGEKRVRRPPPPHLTSPPRLRTAPGPSSALPWHSIAAPLIAAPLSPGCTITVAAYRLLQHRASPSQAFYE